MAVSNKTFFYSSILPFFLSATLNAQACKPVPLLEPISIPLTVSATDPIPGSVADGLLIQASGEINTVSLELQINGDLEQVHLGPLLPSSGFPVFLVDPEDGSAIEVVDGQSLPLDLISAQPGIIEATFFVAGPGGGFSREVPEPLLVIGLTPRSSPVNVPSSARVTAKKFGSLPVLS